MPIAERRERHQAMIEVLRENSITAWHTSFVDTLESVTEPAKDFKLRYG
jgi:trehalose-6-phosphate synthase